MTSTSERVVRAMPLPGGEHSVRANGRAGRTTGFSVRKIWLVMALFGLASIVVELIGHGQAYFVQGAPQRIFQDVELIREIGVYGIAFPVAGGILLTLLNQRAAERDRAVKELGRQRVFGEEIHEITDWSELSARIAGFPGTILPVAHSSLTVIDPESHHAVLAASWAADGSTQTIPDFEMAYSFCRSCLASNSGNPHVVLNCERSDGFGEHQARERHCLPLTAGDTLQAILYFELAEGQQLTDGQRDLLLGYAPQMAAAIENAQLQRLKSSLTEAAAEERQRIARDLHDTLAQNISFLHLKLDQLSHQEGSLQNYAAIQYEIERMRDVADEAYIQVRKTLVGLRLDEHVDATQALTNLASSMAARTDVQIKMVSSGEPLPLTPRIQRQVVYVCREAFNNALQHAHARAIQVEIVWAQAKSTVTISDDGQGFCPENTKRERSYGIDIMHERAASIGGTLTLNSSPGQGTSVSLTFPVPTISSADTSANSAIAQV